MLLLPEVRPALLQCWLAHRTLNGLAKDSGAIAVPKSVWIREGGLRPDGAAAILHRQQRRGNFGNYEHANRFVNAPHEQCPKAVETRKREAELTTREAGSAKLAATDPQAVQERADALAKLRSAVANSFGDIR